MDSESPTSFSFAHVLEKSDLGFGFHTVNYLYTKFVGNTPKYGSLKITTFGDFFYRKLFKMINPHNKNSKNIKSNPGFGFSTFDYSLVNFYEKYEK